MLTCGTWLAVKEGGGPTRQPERKGGGARGGELGRLLDRARGTSGLVSRGFSPFLFFFFSDFFFFPRHFPKEFFLSKTIKIKPEQTMQNIYAPG